MEKLIIIIAILFSALAIEQDIQKKQVPSHVVNSFESNYSKAGDVNWSTEDGLYKVTFTTDHKLNQRIWYQSSGDIEKQEEQIPESDWPGALLSEIQKEHLDYWVEDVKKVSRHSEVYYSIALDSHFFEREINVKPTGEILLDLE